MRSRLRTPAASRRSSRPEPAVKRVEPPDSFFIGLAQWRDEAVRLRSILLSCGLEETIKWGGPVYTADGRNVVGLAAFKSYFGLWFFNGATLSDREGVLVNAQQGKTKSMRQWRMTSAKDIRPALIKAYVREAVSLGRTG